MWQADVGHIDVDEAEIEGLVEHLNAARGCERRGSGVRLFRGGSFNVPGEEGGVSRPERVVYVDFLPNELERAMRKRQPGAALTVFLSALDPSLSLPCLPLFSLCN